ncbi:hypothetical protein AVEN_12451-1 [Araneus ventricosus]|uniref:Uncharacterized protein n=1 Tax=Araneus ventricosus TaxID=182803 RepID=A0A4Y2MYE7_ARAVE|nr:hypothetical protein AVEN_12451-1 [Araneus ventricosus]
MFKFRHFPNFWKTARVLPILKPGKDPTHPVSYRPISLLPTLSTSLFLLKTQTLHQENFRQAYPKGEFWPLYGETCSLSADNDSAMGDIEPRTRPAVPGSSYEHCIEKVRLESEMVKSRVKLEGLFKRIKMMDQYFYHP